MKSQADFKGIMLYASQLFGIYQTLRRWRIRIISSRFDKFRNALYPNLAMQTRTSQRAPLQLQLDRETGAELATDTGPQALSISDVQPPLAPDIDCGIARLLQRDIGRNPPREWGRLITIESMAARLEKLKIIVTKPTELHKFPDIAEYIQSFNQAIGTRDHAQLMQSLFEKEARISSYLTFLTRHKPTQLNELFFTAPQAEDRPTNLAITATTAQRLGHM